MGMGRRGKWSALGPIVAAVAASSSGCKWVPRRAETAQATPPAMIGMKDTPANPRDETAAVPLPPLPPLRSIDDSEAFRPSPPTPLLDAAAARNAALKQALAVELDAPPPPVRPPRPAPEPEAQTVAKPAEPSEDAPVRADPSAPKIDPDVVPAAYGEVLRPMEVPAGESRPLPNSGSLPPVLEPPPPVVASPAEPAQVAVVVERPTDADLWESVLSALAAAPAVEPVVAAAEKAFAISDLRLCKRVTGFGRTEPLSSATCRPGQAVLLYCELEGLRDEETADGFRSRLASSIAILPAAGGEPVWSEDLGTAEDRCRRRRRDFFVNYRITLPADLAPGEYQVRLVQKDLLGDREVSRTIPLTVRSAN